MHYRHDTESARPSYPCFSRYNFRKRTLSSQPRFIFFILPSWEIKPEHAVVRVSSPTSLDTTSLAMNAGELGDSAGGRRRTDMVNGWRVFARENTWGSGFNDEGIECDSVGDRSVGGSYLKSVIGQTAKSRKALHMLTHRIHMTNTLNLFTGTGHPLKSSANLRRPRPLLVVHSGKTTTGRFAELRISSRLE
jgi:hypothetical protein